MPQELSTKVLVDGLKMPEGMRWHEDKLWFSDMIAKRVMTTDAAGRTEIIASFDDVPSGLGFLADGSAIVALMWKRQLRRIDKSGAVSVYADFAHLPGGRINDIVTDGKYRTYVNSNLKPHERSGFDDARDLGDALFMVDPEGRSSIAVTGDIIQPNGMGITPDMKTLILAEVFAHRLTAFTIREDGTLTDRRLFADLGKSTPDGICLDAEGAAWVSSPLTCECFRVREGGEVTHRIALPYWSVCCGLGGPEGKTLFVATIKGKNTGGDMSAVGGINNVEAYLKDAVGRIETVEVQVPGAGW